MPNVWSFSVPIAPIPKQYARVTQSHGNVWAYVPDNVLKAQRTIASVVEGKGAWFAEHVGVKIEAIFYREDPDTPTMRRIRQLCKAYDKPLLPVIEADCDNYIKLVVDALAGICYPNDRQVTTMNIKKRFVKSGEKPHIEFTLQEDEGV